MMPLVTLQEYAETHNVDLNALHLLVTARRIPHKRMLGRIYVDAQVLEKMEKEQEWWERQFRGKNSS